MLQLWWMPSQRALPGRTALRRSLRCTCGVADSRNDCSGVREPASKADGAALWRRRRTGRWGRSGSFMGARLPKDWTMHPERSMVCEAAREWPHNLLSWHEWCRLLCWRRSVGTLHGGLPTLLGHGMPRVVGMQLLRWLQLLRVYWAQRLPRDLLRVARVPGTSSLGLHPACATKWRALHSRWCHWRGCGPHALVVACCRRWLVPPIAGHRMGWDHHPAGDCAHESLPSSLGATALQDA